IANADALAVERGRGGVSGRATIKSRQHRCQRGDGRAIGTHRLRQQLVIEVGALSIEEQQLRPSRATGSYWRQVREEAGAGLDLTPLVALGSDEPSKIGLWVAFEKNEAVVQARRLRIELKVC